MKLYKTAIYALIPVLAMYLTACSSDDTPEWKTATPAIHIIAAKVTGPVTRLATTSSTDTQDNYLAPGEQVAVYVENTDVPSSGEYNGGLPYCFQIPAVTSSTHYLINENTDTLKYPNTGSRSVNIYALYPYCAVAENLRTNTNLLFTVQRDQTTVENYRKSDLMMAEPVTSKVIWEGTGSDRVNNTPPAILNFTHKLTKVTVILKKADVLEEDDLSGYTLTLNAAKPTTVVNLYNFSVSGATGVQEDIVMGTLDQDINGEERFVTSCIVIPQELEPGKLLTLHKGTYGSPDYKEFVAEIPFIDMDWKEVGLNGQESIWHDDSDGINFQSGYEYRMEATVTADGTLDITLKAIIQDFRPDGEYSGMLVKK